MSEPGIKVAAGESNAIIAHFTLSIYCVGKGKELLGCHLKGIEYQVAIQKSTVPLFIYLETGSHYVAQVGFQLTICLPQPSECWDYRRAPSYLATIHIKRGNTSKYYINGL
jgi:hypothetical protein